MSLSTKTTKLSANERVSRGVRNIDTLAEMSKLPRKWRLHIKASDIRVENRDQNVLGLLCGGWDKARQLTKCMFIWSFEYGFEPAKNHATDLADLKREWRRVFRTDKQWRALGSCYVRKVNGVRFTIIFSGNSYTIKEKHGDKMLTNPVGYATVDSAKRAVRRITHKLRANTGENSNEAV